jgi:hypothetical protein
MIVGIVMGIIGGFLLVIAATLWLICRRRNQRFMMSVVSNTDMIEQYPIDMAETSSTHRLVPPRKTTLEPNRVRQTASKLSMRPPSDVVSSGVSNVAEPSLSPSRSMTTPQASSSHQSRTGPHVPLADSGSRPSTSSPDIPTERLTPAQVEIVQQLSEHNVPGPTLATLIDGMVRRESSTRRKARYEPNTATRPSESGRADKEDVPPAYEYRDAPR